MPEWFVWLIWISLLFLFYFILSYYKFSKLYFLAFWGMRKRVVIYLEGESIEFWKKRRFCFYKDSTYIISMGESVIKGKKIRKESRLQKEGMRGFSSSRFKGTGRIRGSSGRGKKKKDSDDFWEWRTEETEKEQLRPRLSMYAFHYFWNFYPCSIFQRACFLIFLVLLILVWTQRGHSLICWDWFACIFVLF